MARDFDGSTGFLTVGDVSAIDITGGELSLHAWIKPDSVGGGTERKIVAKWAAGQLQYLLRIDDTGKLVFHVHNNGGTGGSATSATTISTSAWTACGANFQSGGCNVFVNGVNDGSGSVSLSLSNTSAPLEIGCGSTAHDAKFDGRIAEVAIWNTLLSDAEFLAMAKGANPGLIRRGALKGYWPIYGAGSPEPDMSGNSNNATLTGTANAANHAPVGLLVPDMVAGFSSSSPVVVQTVAVPFISAATTVYAPTLAGSGTVTLTVPFISAATTVYAPTLASVTINPPFIATTTTVYAPVLAGQPMGVSIAFDDPLLEPYPTWTRIG